MWTTRKDLWLVTHIWRLSDVRHGVEESYHGVHPLSTRLILWWLQGVSWSQSQLTLAERQGTPSTCHQCIVGLTETYNHCTIPFTPTVNFKPCLLYCKYFLNGYFSLFIKCLVQVQTCFPDWLCPMIVMFLLRCIVRGQEAALLFLILFCSVHAVEELEQNSTGGISESTFTSGSERPETNTTLVLTICLQEMEKKKKVWQ